MTAFYLRDKETYLSVDWLKSETEVGVEGVVNEVRDTLRTNGYGVSKNGRFSVLNVGHVNRIMSSIFVEHKPTKNNPCHAGICGFAKGQEREVALMLRALVKDEEIYPGIA